MVEMSDFHFGQFVLRFSRERAGRYIDMTIPLNPDPVFFHSVKSRHSKLNHS